MTESKPTYDIARPQDQIKGEPDLWYNRFIRYYLSIDVGRSIYAAYKRYKVDKDGKEPDYDGANRQWYQIAEQWQWEKRANEYDKRDLVELLDNIDELRVQVKAKRIKSLLQLLSKVDQALEAKSVDSMQKETGASLSQAKKTAVRELREELDGYTSKQITELEIVIRELPEPLQSALIQALNKR